MRHLAIVGHRRGNEIRLARFCTAHGAWMSAEDFAAHMLGSPTLHGECDECFALRQAQLDSIARRAMQGPGGGNAA